MKSFIRRNTQDMNDLEDMLPKFIFMTNNYTPVNFMLLMFKSLCCCRFLITNFINPLPPELELIQKSYTIFKNDDFGVLGPA